MPDSPTEPPRPPGPRRAWPVWGWIAVMVLLLGVAVAVRVRLLDLPIERDEGEYAYMGQEILRGVPPYREAANMKWPGTYLAYAAILGLGGETPAAIHAGGLVVNLASSLFLFVLGRRFLGSAAGAAAAGSHALLTLMPSTLGLSAHATHFVMTAALAGFVVLTGGARATAARCAAAGLLFGVAALMKQTGAGFGVLAAVWLAVRAWRGDRAWRRLAAQLGALGAGGLAPLAATAVWLWMAGVWEPFWNWTVVYAREYASLVDAAQARIQFAGIAPRLWADAPGLWAGAAAGLVAVAVVRTVRAAWFETLSFAAVAAASVCPGWFFREHYFLLLMPAVALLVGAAVQAAWNAGAGWRRQAVVRAAVLLAFGAAAGHALWQGRVLYFQLTPVQACRALFPQNPFVEAVEIGRYLRENTAPDARIAIVGSEPEILFYARRRSATDYLYTYPFQEPQRFAAAMQRHFVQQVEAVDPDHVVFVAFPNSWLTWKPGEPDLFRWMAGYHRRSLHIVGVAELRPDGESVVTWPEGRPVALPRSVNWMLVLRHNRLAR